MRSPELTALGLLLAATAGSVTAFAAPVADPLRDQALKVVGPLPRDMATAAHPITPERVELGRALFFDPRISADGTVSCARCHLPALYGTDALLAQSRGAHGRLNPRNAPTVLNAALQAPLHWRGDRQDVEDQATQALVGPVSFANPEYAAAVARLKAIPGYSERFRKAFPDDADPATAQNWGAAIGAYERTLVTPGAFDAWLAGDDDALPAQAKAGLSKFIGFGCTACHNGPGVGGQAWAKFGLFGDYWKATGSRKIDRGRIDVTGKAEDLYVFKAPVLRNVAMTPPYFHDGSVARLEDAVRIMARVQLNRELSDGDIADLTAFLHSLTGPLPASFSAAPVLPSAPFRAMASDAPQRQ